MTPDVEKSKNYNLNCDKFLRHADPQPEHQKILNFQETSAGANIIIGNNKNAAVAGDLVSGGHFAALSDIGNSPGNVKRAKNEDALFKVEVKDITYIAVADGIGGAPAGEIASYAFLDYMGKSLINGANVDEAMLAGASGVVYTHLACRRSNGYKGEVTADMGACFAMAEIVNVDGSQLCRTYHCGDARAYIIKKDLIHQTRDHTAVNEHLDHGLLNPGDIIPEDIVDKVSRYVGINEGCFAAEQFNVEVSEFFLLEEGEVVLVGSDGLSDNLNIEEIKAIYDSLTGIKERRMIEFTEKLYQAVENKINGYFGTIDNITIAAYGV